MTKSNSKTAEAANPKKDGKILIEAGASLICPFCGQARTLMHNIYIDDTPESRDEAAALECGCVEACQYRNRKKSKDNVPMLLDGFLDFCEREDQTDASPVCDSIKRLAFDIIDEFVGATTLTVKGTKVKLSLKEGQLVMKLEHKKGVTQTT